MTFLPALNFSNISALSVKTGIYKNPIIAAKAAISLLFTTPSLRGVQRRGNPEWASLRLWIAASLTLLAMTGMAYAATSIPFTIHTSEAVNVTGTPRIAVDVGGVTRYATYTSGSGTNALTFTYAMVAGDVDLDGVTLSSPIQLNGGTIKDVNGNDATLTFTVPNTSNVKVNYPSLGMDFVYDADGRYTLNGTVYNDLTSFLSATGGTFTRSGTSQATYFDSSGVIRTAVTNTPRFDYDPVTHEAKGILIEESRTNLALYSNISSGLGIEYSGGYGGSASAPIITPNYASAPDGSLTAARIQLTLNGGTTTASRAYLTGSPPPTDNVTRTLSIYAKSLSGTPTVLIRLHGSATYYTLSTGSWTRISAKGSSTTDLTRNLIEIRGGQPTPNSDNADILVWGAQLEQGAFPTSYIPTTTAAVTRSADVLTVPTGSWLNTTSGTLYSENQIPFLGGASWPAVVSLDDGTSSNAIHMFVSDAGTDEMAAEIFNGGSGQFSYYGAPYLANQTSKRGIAFATNSAISASNGVLSTLDNSITLPTVNKLWVGKGRGGNLPLNGTIRKLKYYPSRIANTQLQLMTQ